MATSLARQLQALRSDTIATLDKRKHDKISSLLFESAEAAAQDYESILALGLNGLHGLIQFDARFQRFEDTLFAETSTEIDRTIQTKAENQSWDAVINEFLDLVAPHALSREAAKALEWLIRRFKIHQFPTSAEALLFTFLPYHAEPLYLRLLQIVPLPPLFAFLSQYHDIRVASTLPPVPRQLLIRALSRDSTFLNRYFDFIVSRIKSGYGYPAMIVTWTTLAVEAVVQMRQARVSEETVVSQIMPYIAQGLQMKGSPDFQIACYTVLTVLATNRTLTDKVINAAMDSICQGWTEQSQRLGILCLVTLAQTREGEALSDTVTQSLLSVKDLVSIMESLPSKAHITKLLVPLAKKLLPSFKEPENRPLLTAIILSGRVPSSDRQVIIQAAVSYLFDSNKNTGPAIGKWLASYAKEHTEDFKASVAPLLSTLEDEKLEELEKLCQLTLKDQEGDEMNGVEYVTTKSAELTINRPSSLPKELPHPSFFAISSDHTIFLDLFVDTSISGNVDKVFSLSTLSESAVTLPSLLARVWIFTSYPILARTSALRKFTQLITQDCSVDFQGFIPHLIAALSDVSNDVRGAAADAFSALNETYSANKTSVLGLEDLYPENNNSAGSLKWLSTTEAKWLIGIVLTKLAECRLDSHYVLRLLTEILNRAGKKGKKEQNPTSTMVFLASHVVCSGLSSLQYSLLQLLNDATIENPNSIKLKAQSLQLLLERCKDTASLTALLSQDNQIDPTYFKMLLVEIVGPGSSSSQISILLDLVRSHGPLAICACRQLSIVFPAAGEGTRLQIAKLLVNQLEDASSDLAKTASSTLDSIKLPTSVILSLLDDIIIDVDSQDSSPARKRQRVESARSSPGTIPEDLVASTRQLTLLLEVLERQDLEQHIEVVTPLFRTLEQLLAVEGNTRTTLNYPKQLLLSSLISIVQKLKNSSISIDSNIFRVDSLIACIRTSANPQVHNKALLLLSELAQVVPDIILNQVMPIFTFMGTNVLRQDDEYSSHVIEQTVKSIIPMLATASARGKAYIDTTPIISAFVVNFDFIPKHRRLSLFKVLLATLGPEEHIPIALFLLAERSCETNDRTKTATSEFGADLFNSFSLVTLLKAVDSFLKLIAWIPSHESEDVGSLPIDVRSYSPEKLASLKTECLATVSAVVHSRSFKNVVARVFAAGDISVMDADYFSPIMEKLLLQAPPSSKDMGNIVAHAIDGILSALPLLLVANIVETFINAKTHDKVTIEMIFIVCNRLTRLPTSDVRLNAPMAQLLSLLKQLVQSSEDIDAMTVALNCIGKLSRVHGKAQLSMFEDVLPTVAMYGIRSEKHIIVQNASICLLSMLPVLGARIVPFLPQIIPVILDKLKHLDGLAPLALLTHSESSHQDLEKSLLDFIAGLYERIPTFMTSYVNKVMQILLQAATSGDEAFELMNSRAYLRTAVTQHMSTEVCIESLAPCWTTVPHKRKTLQVFIQILDEIISKGSREDLTGSSKIFFELFLKLFDLRNEDVKTKTVKEFEGNVSDVFLKLVMRLNDTTFRPFFITLRNWTFQNIRGEVKLHRQIFFYNLVNKFLDILQTVVTAYYGIILDDTVGLLNNFESGEVKSKELWTSVINSLRKSFTYDLDQDAYWSSPSRFEKVVKPLLSQLTLHFKSSAAIPAIVALASKARSDDNFKVINGYLMEYMKSETNSLRLVAVNVQRELYTNLSGDWLKMLPPTVPLISELMEDEDDGVVEATHGLITTIEKVGGISMQKLLT